MGWHKAMPEHRSRAIADRLTDDEEYDDFPEFASRYFKVLNRSDTSGRRSSGYVNLVLNPVQLDFYEKIKKSKKDGRPGRFVVLKARRMGLSTVSQAYMFHQCLTNRERRAFITAADQGTTNNIFLMAKSMLEHLPRAPTGPRGGMPGGLTPEQSEEWRKNDLRPEHRRNNDNQLWLTHPNNEDMGLNSRFDVACAASVKSARGFELHYFHGSEVAFWDDAEKFMLGLMPTFSETPETLIVLESTANGAGGYFHDKFWRHWKGHGSRREKSAFEDDDEAWESIFYAWWQMPFYVTPLPKDMTAREFLDRMPEEVLAMVDEYDLAPEQAYWAYRTWKDKMEENWDLFRQEYPSNPQEAFAFAASRVFPEPAIRTIESKSVVDAGFRGHIFNEAQNELVSSDALSIGVAADMKPKLRGAHDGPLWCWGKPKEGHSYILFMDVASGRATGDYTAIQVVDRESRVQAAEWWGQVDPHQAAQAMILLALYYNDGMICWETNGPGHYVSLAVNMSQYWNVYLRDHVETIAMDQRIGWVTNMATKPLMVSTGETLVRLEAPIIRSKRLIAEMRRFLEFAKKATSTGGIIAGDENYKRLKTGAPVGEHDDLVIAWMGAQTVLSLETGSSPHSFLHTAEEPDPPGRWEKAGRGTMDLAWDDDDGVVSDRPSGTSVGMRWL